MRRHPKFFGLMLVLLFACFTSTSFAGPIGHLIVGVQDEHGKPLQATIMVQGSHPNDMIIVRSTDKKGGYNFQNLDASCDWSITIIAEEHEIYFDTVSFRPNEYRQYIVRLHPSKEVKTISYLKQ